MIREYQNNPSFVQEEEREILATKERGGKQKPVIVIFPIF
jgi:hypothetical protein